MPEKNEPGETSGRWRGVGLVAALLLALPLLYFLSVGPVVMIFDKTNGLGGMVSSSFVINLYSPIIWLHEHTFLRQTTEIYLGLWGLK